MQFFTCLAALAAVAAPFLVGAAPVSPRAANEVIPGKYIIQLKPDTDVASIAAHHSKVRSIYARNLARRSEDDSSVGVEHEFQIGDFKAYAGSFDDATIEELKALPEVLVVEQDFMMHTNAVVTQSSAPWGLAQISSRTLGASSYSYDDTTRQETYSYIVDTGIRLTHNEFEGRATWGFNAVSGSTDTDNEGHGTHVAGTVGGKTYGVAKKTNLVAVKVFDGANGSASAVIAGYNWAVNDIVSKNRQNTAVINMSLGGQASTTWDAAMTAGFSRGVLSVVAAGNENKDASTSSPARSPEVICVGNMQRDGSRRSGQFGSNYGPVVDIFAAGTEIVSAAYTSDSGTSTKTGTSMASPHVAGLVSYLRGLEGPSTAAGIKARIYALGTKDVVTDVQGSVNLLAYNGVSR
ncbi:subtilisin-like protein [Phaeosphaeriaceae sp. SRC1lsM3a]|nr:subtilisin-like protein [Stagonospora sp. SRC1lsM3a]